MLNKRNVGSFGRMPWLVLSLVLCLAMIGEAKTVLTVAGHQTTWNVVGPIAREYMALHSDVEIEHLYIRTDNYDGMNKILAMTAGGELPDIIHASLSLSPELLAANIILPVPEDIAADIQRIFLPPLIPTVTYQGKIMGIPTENQTYVLGYNQRLFEEVGLVGAPQTWDDLAAYAKKLTRADGQGNVIQRGFGISGVTDYLRFSHTFINLLWSNGGVYIDDDMVAHLTDPAARETVQFLRDIYAPGYLSFSDSMRNERAAMASTPTYYRGSLMNLHDYDRMRTTVMPNNRGPKVAYQYGWAMFASNNNNPQKQAIVWDFLRYLTMELLDDGTTRMGNQLIDLVGALPASRTDLSRAIFRTDPFFGGFIDSLAVSRAEPLIPQVNLRLDELFKAVKPAIEGKISVAQAVEDAQMRITNNLANFKNK
ncbi:MAG TPA: extracellular solute-binding protein [Firmicutes bacterium]|jgi:multiple sugar transport system substrate-binding protein|nr:extracellular solute-binding protein [Bacillota bacterium]